MPHVQKVKHIRDFLLANEEAFYQASENTNGYMRGTPFVFTERLMTESRNRLGIPDKELLSILNYAEGRTRLHSSSLWGRSDIPGGKIRIKQAYSFIFYLHIVLSKLEDYFDKRFTLRKNRVKDISNVSRELTNIMDLQKDAIFRSINSAREKGSINFDCAFSEPLYKIFEHRSLLTKSQRKLVITFGIERTRKRILDLTKLEAEQNELIPIDVFKEFTAFTFRHLTLTKIEDVL